jgi:hypothetical protein
LAKLFSRIDADGSGQAYQLVGLAVGWDGLACVLNKIIHKSKGGSGMLVCGCSGVCVRARVRATFQKMLLIMPLYAFRQGISPVYF